MIAHWDGAFRPLPGEFGGPLRCEDLLDGDRILTFPLEYRARDGELFTICRRARINGASVPRLLWPLLGHPWSPPYGRATALHDDLYRWGGTTRKRADALFLEAMEACWAEYARTPGTKPSWWAHRVKEPARRQALYRGVRVGGWVPWAAHRCRT